MTGGESPAEGGGGPTVVLVDPDSAEGRSTIAAFFADIIARRLGRRATSDEIETAMRNEPSSDLGGETGMFVIVREAERTIGCGGIRIVDAETGELSRIFVASTARGRGVATMLLRDLEQRARNRALGRLRLTVRDDLAEARALYERAGYGPVEPFSASPYADRFLAKDL